jgi:hypothetical protein
MNAVLTPHPSTPGRAVHRLEASVSTGAGGTLGVSYRLTGDLGRVRIPELSASGFADELWQHTCFELFARREGDEEYRELNFSPSGEWAVYAFERYREGMRRVADARARRIAVSRRGDTLELDATIDAARVGMRPPLRVALAAVVEEMDGTLSYWALAHAAGKPDFHHASAFTLELE